MNRQEIKIDRASIMPVIKEALAQYPQLTGASVGIISKDGVEKVGLRFKVERKVALESLEPHMVLPKKFKGYDVDVIQGIPKIQVQAERKAGDNPRAYSEVLRPGHSIGAKQRTGTLGGFLHDKKSGVLYALTNNHVLPKIKEPVYHPGPADTSKEVVGEVVSTTNEHIDAALFKLRAWTKCENIPVGLDYCLRQHVEPKLLDTVVKMGRTTMLTYGKIVGFGMVRLGYDTGMQNISSIEIRPLKDGNPENEEISKGGDSGSLWTLKDGSVVGLHFAGEGSPDPMDEIAYACPLQNVIDHFNQALGADFEVFQRSYPMPAQEEETKKLKIVAQLDGITASLNIIKTLLK